MKLSDYAAYDGVGLAQLIQKGEVSRREIVDVANSVIEALNGQLNFIAHLTPDDVERTLSDTEGEGLFLGVPFFIKESAMKGQPWNMASRLGVGRIAEKDDEMTARFRRAGVTIMGISTMPEWGNAPTTESVLHGPTRNPWNIDYMAGGSSGGAAAAVAAGVVPIAHASDGGGSIRIPAACCGLVGLKPTRARTPGYQCGAFSLGVGHIVSRSVRDSAAMLDSIHGPEVGDVYYVQAPKRPYLEELAQAPKPLRIAYSYSSLSGAAIDEDCIKAVKQAASVCESLGHQIEEKPLPYEWEAFCQAFTHLWSYRHPYSVELLEKEMGRMSGPDTRETCNLAMLEHGKQITMLEFDRSLRNLEQICRDVGRFFTQYDVFISPVTTRPALKLGELDANAPDLTAPIWVDRMISHYAMFTPIFNLTGQPAISLPLYHTANGLPVGVQFAAPHGDEASLFQLAGQLQQALPWNQRKPEYSILKM